MTPFRIALANIRFPQTAEESIWLSQQAIRDGRAARAELVCFPSVFVPGHRAAGKNVPPAGSRVDLDLATGLLAKRYKPLA